MGRVRRRTRPMACFVNVQSVDRIIDAIFNGMNEKSEWKNRTSTFLHTQLDITPAHKRLDKRWLVC